MVPVWSALFNPILRALSIENLDAFKNGAEIPNIITGQFQDMFATLVGRFDVIFDFSHDLSL